MTAKPRLRPIRRKAGFTLMEAALTTVIVGVGVLSIVEAQQAYHQKNDWAARVGTAESLANEIRELTMPLPFADPLSGASTLGPEGNEASVSAFDDLDDFAGTQSGSDWSGTVINPPVNALGVAIADLNRWTQVVTVESVSQYDMGGAALALGSTDLMRVRVSVLYTPVQTNVPEEVTNMSWVVKRRGG